MDHPQSMSRPGALQRAAERERGLRAALTNAACTMESTATTLDSIGLPAQAKYLREKAAQAFTSRDEAWSARDISTATAA
jgi:hypothetical protein